MKRRYALRVTMRAVALSMCGVALGVFLAFAPTRVSADCCECTYGGAAYSVGACVNGSMCQCGQPPNCGCAWIGDWRCDRPLD